MRRIKGLEERAFNAWPSLETVLVDGWVLRFAAGYTKRSNSVNALRPETSTVVIAELAAPLYAARQLPLIFRLSPLAPADADATLAARGFRSLDDTRVMTAQIDATTAIDPQVVIFDHLDASWARGFAEANRVSPAHRQTHDRMLEAIRFPVAFASLMQSETAIAWGLAVAERGMVGLFDIVTSPAARRQGAARRLVGSLLAWGRSQGASEAYLQVVSTNAAAIPLYVHLGFSEVYRYHYRAAT